MQPIDIYLKQEFYDWLNLGKDYELRAPFGIYAPKNIQEEQPLIVHKGGSGIFSKGKIGKVIHADLDEILEEVSHKRFAPPIFSEAEFRTGVGLLLGSPDKYIAFQLILRQ